MDESGIDTTNGGDGNCGDGQIGEASNNNGKSQTNSGSINRKRQPQSQSVDSAMIPITADGEKPQKKFYRQRAHCNPLSHNTSFDYPRTPSQIDWTKDHYPNLVASETTPTIAPTVLDIGCGFGGLTVALSTLLPDERILGMEIRAKVTEYVRLRILALRKDHSTSLTDANVSSANNMYENASVLRTNSMKYLPNYFGKASLSKLFFCFPDPHFKRKNWPRRIVSDRLLTEYAYVLKPGTGRLYTITDVKELHDWHVAKCNAHPMFEQLTVHDSNESEFEKDAINDPCIHAMYTETEEGKKVARNGGKKYFAVYRRIGDDEIEKSGSRRLVWTTKNFFDPIEENSGDDDEAPEQ
jgi:tRNA (guanine-N7-)-methyltransferase